MQTYTIEKDIILFGVKADSFPAGVHQAWQKLHSLLPSIKGRAFYGISHGTINGQITYYACVEETYPGENGKDSCSTLVVPKGKYIGKAIDDYMNHVHKIGETFQVLLATVDYDKNGFCLERYVNDREMICMIKKAELVD